MSSLSFDNTFAREPARRQGLKRKGEEGDPFSTRSRFNEVRGQRGEVEKEQEMEKQNEKRVKGGFKMSHKDAGGGRVMR